MKRKRYLSPRLQVVGVRQQAHLMAGSPGVGFGEGAADKDGEVLSRGDDFWDDEE
ncbi:MAG: hypothetical protein IJ612_07150 [Prevotella sp.]|nr:hypothetical protein [Prevotella sp.]